MMFKLRPYLASLLLGLLILAPFAGAADALPSAAAVQKSLATLDARDLPDAERKALQDTLQKTLDNLQTLKTRNAELAALKQQLAGTGCRRASSRWVSAICLGAPASCCRPSS